MFRLLEKKLFSQRNGPDGIFFLRMMGSRVVGCLFKEVVAKINKMFLPEKNIMVLS